MIRFLLAISTLAKLVPQFATAAGVGYVPCDAPLRSGEQVRYSEEHEALYLKRFQMTYGDLSPSTIRGPGSQTPLAEILGADSYIPLPSTKDTQSTVSQAALDAAEEYASRRNSIALIIWRKGKIEREAYFGGATRDSLVISGALSKPMSVLAVGRAIQEGFIESLGQSVSDFLTEWRGSPKERITVGHLLSMRSGLLPQDFNPDPESVMTRAYLHPCHEDIIINQYPMAHEPGSRYEYSNVNSELVAPLIERATGVDYEDWISQELLIPLGAKGGQIWINRPNGIAHAGSGALLPAETFLRLAMLVALKGAWNGRDLLSSDFVSAMMSPTPQNVNAGMGLYIGSPYKERRGPLNPEETLGTIFHSEPYAADDLVLFDGNANQVAYIIPSEELVILRVGRWPGKGKEWDNSYLPNVIIRGFLAAR